MAVYSNGKQPKENLYNLPFVTRCGYFALSTE